MVEWKRYILEGDESIIDHDSLLNFTSSEHFTEASIDHTAISNIGTNSHSDIDTAIADHPHQDVQTTASPDFVKVTANTIESNGNIFINYDGPEGDGILYFYDGGSPGGAFIRWDDSEDEFVLSHGINLGTGKVTAEDMEIAGTTTATLTIRSGTGTYDTAIKFYDTITAKWYIGVDDSVADTFCIGTGSLVGSNRLMYMTSNSVYYTEGANFQGDCVINGGKFELTNGSRITINPTITFQDQDTTPDVGSGNSFITNNGRATTITKFDAAKGDQVFTIICNDANTTIQNNSDIALSGSANFVMASGDTLTMLYSEALSKCIEISRMVS